jgi:hypothetical protein
VINFHKGGVKDVEMQLETIEEQKESFTQMANSRGFTLSKRYKRQDDN